MSKERPPHLRAAGDRLQAQATAIIVDAMERKGMRNRDLARRVDVSQSVVYSMLRGRVKISLNMLANMADALDLELTITAKPK